MNNLLKNYKLKGALTNKFSEFNDRKWELKEYNIIDIFDNFGSTAKVLLKGNKISKVISRENYNLNKEYITNNIRYYFINYYNNRISSPLYLYNNKYNKVSWKFSILKFNFDLVFFNFCKKLNWNLNFLGYVGLNITKESAFVFKQFVNKLGFSNIINNKILKSNLNFLFDFRQNIIIKFNKRLKYDSLFLIGVNLRIESPLLFIFLKDSLNIKCVYNCLINNFFNNKVKSIDLGSNLSLFFNYMKGISIYSIDFLNYNNPLFIFGYKTLFNFIDSFYYYVCFGFFKYNLNYCNIIFPNIIYYNTLDLGIYYRLNSLSKETLLKENNNFFFNFFFSVLDDFNNSKSLNNVYSLFKFKKLNTLKLSYYIHKSINVYQGSFNYEFDTYLKNKSVESFNYIFSSKKFYEMNSIFFNCFGFFNRNFNLKIEYKSVLDDLNIFFLFFNYILNKKIFVFFKIISHLFKFNSINIFYLKYFNAFYDFMIVKEVNKINLISSNIICSFKLI